MPTKRTKIHTNSSIKRIFFNIRKKQLKQQVWWWIWYL